MLYSVLKVVEPVRFEIEAVGHADIVFRVGSVTDVNVFIPSFLGWITDILQWIDSVHVECELWKRHRHDMGKRVLAMARVGGEVEQIAEAGLICDTRLESVAQVFVR